MEFLNGGDLMQHLDASGKFDEERSRFYAAEMLCGLQYLHGRGVIYRSVRSVCVIHGSRLFVYFTFTFIFIISDQYTHSLARSLARSLTHSLTHSLTNSLTSSFTHSSTLSYVINMFQNELCIFIKCILFMPPLCKPVSVYV